LPYGQRVHFDETLQHVRGLCGRNVNARLFDADDKALVHWEGELVEEELDTEAIAHRLDPQVVGQAEAEARVRALREGHVALFQVGNHPFVLDRIDTTSAERIEPEGIRVRDSGGTTVELVPDAPQS
jgi:hypothetical protein